MFGKKYLKRELEEEKEDEMINEVSNESEDEIIKPIIFVGEKVYRDPGLNELPYQHMLNYNKSAAQLAKSVVLPLGRSAINSLNFNNLHIITEQAANNIIQNTFFNFCSVIDSMNCSLLDYFPIKQVVHDYMNTIAVNVRNMVMDFVGGSNAPSSLKNTDEDINNMKNFAQFIAGQITNYLFGDICYATDNAINDILLQVHLVPNIDYIYSTLYNESEFLQKNWKNRKKFDGNFGELAAIYLKGVIREQLDNNLYTIMLVSTHNILGSCILTIYYVYNDIYHYSRELDSKNQHNKIDKE